MDVFGCQSRSSQGILIHVLGMNAVVTSFFSFLHRIDCSSSSHIFACCLCTPADRALRAMRLTDCLIEALRFHRVQSFLRRIMHVLLQVYF